MDKKKIIGVFLIFFGILVAVWLFLDIDKKEDSTKIVTGTQQSVHIEQNKQVDENESEQREQDVDASGADEAEEINIEDQNEAGESEDEALIQSVDCQIGAICDEIMADIDDMEGFEYAVKQYVFENGYIGGEIYSLDTVTINYQERWKQYLMGIKEENHYFCVIYDMDHGTYRSEKF